MASTMKMMKATTSSHGSSRNIVSTPTFWNSRSFCLCLIVPVGMKLLVRVLLLMALAVPWTTTTTSRTTTTASATQQVWSNPPQQSVPRPLVHLTKTAAATPNDDSPPNLEHEEIVNALAVLESLGVPRDFICHPYSNEYEPHLLYCYGGDGDNINDRNDSRYQFLRTLEEVVDGAEEEDHDLMFLVTHALMAFACVCTAALAAGLTMGLLSLDPLLLLIKMRAGSTTLEQEQAASLLPLVKQHHQLLVTLLLLNSIANEALPLFLEVLVSPVVAVVLSVTLVLFFGEIIPSAVFTGPNKIAIASQLTPLVRFVMFLLYPIAYPIAKLLDHVLHDDDPNGGSGSDAFNRGELSALVRIQYEERLASKTQRRKERQAVATAKGGSGPQSHDSFHPNHVGGIDFTTSTRSSIRSEVRATKREISHRSSATVRDAGSVFVSNPSHPMAVAAAAATESLRSPTSGDPRAGGAVGRSPSIHIDEVAMVEGALQMKTKMAFDVFTPLHRMFSVPISTALNEGNVVHIYSSGFSRVPVYDDTPPAVGASTTKNKKHPSPKTAIRGILMTRQLMVINSEEARPLATLPLLVPMCVSPKLNLVDLLNFFQKGTIGHMALVCARPQVASDALAAGLALPETAGLMGIITIEDVIEALLQEQIYDESDKMEREMRRLAEWAAHKWKLFVRKRKRARLMGQQDATDLSMGAVVQKAMQHEQAANRGDDSAVATDTTPLVGGSNHQDNATKQGGGLGWLFRFGK